MLIVFLAFRRNVGILVVKHPKHVFVHYRETTKTEVPSYRLHQKTLKEEVQEAVLVHLGWS